MSVTSNIPWVDLPLTDAALKAAHLDKETVAQVQSYARDGFVIFDPQLPDSVLDKALAATKEFCFDSNGNRTRPRILDGWKTNDAIRQIAVHEPILKLLRALYQREPIPFQTLDFPVGTEQKTHSDAMHFSSLPHRFMCGVWVALEDVGHENGPLHYYPGSQKLPFFEMYDIGRSGTAGMQNQYAPEHGGRYENFVEEYIGNQGLEKKELHLKRGMALIWAANLFHGGNPVLDKNSTRFSQVTHYFFKDCIYYTPMVSDPYVGQFFLRKVVNIRTGEQVDHVFNGKNIHVPKKGLYAINAATGKAKRLDRNLLRAGIRKIASTLGVKQKAEQEEHED